VTAGPPAPGPPGDEDDAELAAILRRVKERSAALADPARPEPPAAGGEAA
jgi:hypothetical protein